MFDRVVGSPDDVAERTERAITSGVLIVAATGGELCGHEGLVCGVGPVEAAAATARRLAGEPRPAVVLHVGLAGGRGLPVGSVVIGSEAVYCDLAAGVPVESRSAPVGSLLAAATAALPGATVLPIGTSALVGSVPDDLRVEAMEGFAVLRAAALAGVAAIEVRVVSNEVGERDRARWDIEGALEALGRALPPLLRGLA